MNTKLSLCLFILATVLVSIDAHGYMIDPPARGSIFRLNNPASFPSAVFPRIPTDPECCNMRNNTRNVTCGVCGPIYYNDPGYFGNFVLDTTSGENRTVTSYERNSVQYRNVPSMSQYIVKTYKKGELIFPRMKVMIRISWRWISVFISFNLRSTLIMLAILNSESVMLPILQLIQQWIASIKIH